jgi:ABC-type polar amino acid transport system ATPase subunit
VEDLALSRGGARVVSEISFDVERAEVVALMGPSGSGKTTILRALAALEPFDRGTISVDGVCIGPGSISKSAVRQLRRKIGMVFQFHHLFEHLSVLRNVALAPIHVQGVASAEAERRAHDLLQVLGVEHRAAALPRELSGGEAQRVAIARALAVDPPVLLMDEPTASLDVGRRADLSELLGQLAGRSRTLIIATHDEAFARASATRVLRIGEGRLSASAAQVPEAGRDTLSS